MNSILFPKTLDAKRLCAETWSPVVKVKTPALTLMSPEWIVLISKQGTTRTASWMSTNYKYDNPHNKKNYWVLILAI